MVWTLIDSGKLTNQIARLAAIVLKMKFPAQAPVACVVWTLIDNGKLAWGLVIFYWFVLRMQVNLDSLFARMGSAPTGGVKKGEFRDWNSPTPNTVWVWGAEVKKIQAMMEYFSL